MQISIMYTYDVNIKISPVRIDNVHALVTLLSLAVPRMGLVCAVGQGEVLLTGQLGLEHLQHVAEINMI